MEGISLAYLEEMIDARWGWARKQEREATRTRSLMALVRRALLLIISQTLPGLEFLRQHALQPPKAASASGGRGWPVGVGLGTTRRDESRRDGERGEGWAGPETSGWGKI